MFKQLQQLWRRLSWLASNGARGLATPARLTTGLSGRQQHEFVVIGLGRFGSSVAETLVRGGHDVLAIDKDERRVHHLSVELPHVVHMDATNADALRQIGIETFDTGLVCIGSDFESNLLATVLLLRFGVKRVITKARTRTQRTILESVGAHEVILPEQQAGVHLGRRLAFKHFVEYLEISEGIGVVELRAPPSLWGRTLVDANLRQRYYLNVIAVHRGPEVIVNFPGDFIIHEGDVLAVVGRIEDAERLRA
jgi:trk system potassium uptake protein